MSEITNEFFADHLCSRSFNKTFETDKNFNGEPYNVTRKMDLTKVKKKIKDGEYVGVSEWIDDMNAIWDNNIQYYSLDHYIGNIALYYKKKFAKKVQKLTATNLVNYHNQLIELLNNVNDIVMNPPQSLGLTPKSGIPAEFMAPFTVKRIQELMKNVQEAGKDGKVEQIRECLVNSGIDVGDGPVEIDFGKIGRNSLIDLENLVKKNI